MIKCFFKGHVHPRDSNYCSRCGRWIRRVRVGNINRTKLNPREVAAYEKMSGFKTTGEVYFQTWDKKTQAKMDKIMEDIYIPTVKSRWFRK